MSENRQPAPVLTLCLSAGFQKTVLSAPLVLGDVNRLLGARLDAAGKGINVARVLHQLGDPVVALGQGGSNQASLLELAAGEGLRLELVPSSKPLRLCTTVVELELETDDSVRHRAEGLPDRSRVLRVTELVEPSSPVDPGVPLSLEASFAKAIERARMLVVSGSMAPGFPEDFLAGLADAAGRRDLPVILDIRGGELLAALKSNAGIVKINLSEFARTFMPAQAALIEQCEQSGSTGHLREVKDVLTELTEDQDTIFILTRGPAPVLVARNGECTEIAVPRISSRELINPIGSGDAFAAGMAHVLSRAGAGRRLAAIEAGTLADAVKFGIACAQSNARTLRPGWLDQDLLKAQKR